MGVIIPMKLNSAKRVKKWVRKTDCADVWYEQRKTNNLQDTIDSLQDTREFQTTANFIIFLSSNNLFLFTGDTSIDSRRQIDRRIQFAEWVLRRIDDDLRFLSTLFSDESISHSDWWVNKQNSRIWSRESPRSNHKQPFQSEIVVAWQVHLFLWKRNVRNRHIHPRSWET